MAAPALPDAPSTMAAPALPDAPKDMVYFLDAKGEKCHTMPEQLTGMSVVMPGACGVFDVPSDAFTLVVEKEHEAPQTYKLNPQWLQYRQPGLVGPCRSGCSGCSGAHVLTMFLSSTARPDRCLVYHLAFAQVAPTVQGRESGATSKWAKLTSPDGFPLLPKIINIFRFQKRGYTNFEVLFLTTVNPHSTSGPDAQHVSVCLECSKHYLERFEKYTPGTFIKPPIQDEKDDPVTSLMDQGTVRRCPTNNPTEWYWKLKSEDARVTMPEVEDKVSFVPMYSRPISITFQVRSTHLEYLNKDTRRCTDETCGTMFTFTLSAVLHEETKATIWSLDSVEKYPQGAADDAVMGACYRPNCHGVPPFPLLQTLVAFIQNDAVNKDKLGKLQLGKNEIEYEVSVCMICSERRAAKRKQLGYAFGSCLI